MSEQIFFQESFATPTGKMLLLTDAAQRVRAADWEDKEQRMLSLLGRYYRGASFRIEARGDVSAARRALLAYFEGEVTALDAVETATTGTDFQNQVWRALRVIRWGEVVSYRALAQRIGRPAACRAVGLANGANPISIIVPCHRVIGTNSSLTGYGGGLERKRWLLTHENAMPVKGAAGVPMQLSMDDMG
jgi:methylated-DNA-[protein]-cysteine S-methyltransferase